MLGCCTVFSFLAVMTYTVFSKSPRITSTSETTEVFPNQWGEEPAGLEPHHFFNRTHVSGTSNDTPPLTGDIIEQEYFKTHGLVYRLFFVLWPTLEWEISFASRPQCVMTHRGETHAFAVVRLVLFRPSHVE